MVARHPPLVRWPVGLVRTALAFSTATLLLTLGLYVCLRPEGSAYLLPTALWHSIAVSPYWRTVTGSVPSFAHAFAFGIMTALLLPPRRAWIWSACIAWGLVDTVFEIAQMPLLANVVSARLPAFFDQVPVLDHLGRYLTGGTFDPMDVAAAVVGAMFGGQSLTLALRRHERNQSASRKATRQAEEGA